MKAFFLVVVSLILSACSTTSKIPTDYSGEDAGHVVLGFGATEGTRYSTYSLLFKSLNSEEGKKSKTEGRFQYCQENRFCKKEPDYNTDEEEGVVLISSLPPGEYEIFNFDIFMNWGTVQKNFGSKGDFAIPFVVKEGETTYLGNYQANGLFGKNFVGMELPAGAVFVVEDRSEAEFAIAKKKEPLIGSRITNSTPSVESIGSPLFYPPQE